MAQSKCYREYASGFFQTLKTTTASAFQNHMIRDSIRNSIVRVVSGPQVQTATVKIIFNTYLMLHSNSKLFVFYHLFSNVIDLLTGILNRLDANVNINNKHIEESFVYISAMLQPFNLPTSFIRNNLIALYFFFSFIEQGPSIIIYLFDDFEIAYDFANLLVDLLNVLICFRFGVFSLDFVFRFIARAGHFKFGKKYKDVLIAENGLLVYVVNNTDIAVYVGFHTFICYLLRSYLSYYSTEFALFEFENSEFAIIHSFSLDIFSYLNNNYGKFFYLLSGGESNPGPVFSTLRKVPASIANGVARFCFPDLDSYLNTVNSNLVKAGKATVVAMYSYRIITSMIDIISEMFSRFAASALGFYSRILIFVLDVYETYKMLADTLGLKFKIVAEPQAGPSEHFLGAMFLSSMLPPRIKNVLKDSFLFTNFKLLDDASWLFDLFSFVISIPRLLLELLFDWQVNCPTIHKYLQDIEDMFPFGQVGSMSYQMNNFLKQRQSDSRIINDAQYQASVLELEEKYIPFKNGLLERKGVLPVYLRPADKEFISLVKKIKHLRATSRVEPVFVVFYGPPGTGKTTLMREYLEHCKQANSMYQHISEEKDFYDMYDNEDILSIDDVGQKGVWQWANFINMVSTLKCPLQCAEAHLKGTKFFTSKLITATTNRINLTLTADCGISDAGALYRRIDLFNFDRVRFNIVDGLPVFSGVIDQQKYNLVSKQWDTVNNFNLDNISPLDFKTALHNFISGKIGRNQRVIQQNENPVQFDAFPQSFISDLICKSKDTISLVLDYIISNMPSFDTVNQMADFATSDGFILLTIFSAVMYGVYCMLGTTKESLDNVETTKKINKFYNADKYNKFSIQKAMPQSLANLFSLSNSVDIPQLTRIRDNTMPAEFSFVADGQHVCEVSSVVMSGAHFSAPLHIFNFAKHSYADIYVTIWKDKDHAIYDKILVEPVLVL